MPRALRIDSRTGGGSSVGQSSGLIIRWTPFRSMPPCTVTCGSVRARSAQRSDVGRKFLHGFLHGRLRRRQ